MRFQIAAQRFRQQIVEIAYPALLNKGARFPRPVRPAAQSELRFSWIHRLARKTLGVPLFNAHD
jgi:hypothetical protein